jgi:hypothetical protein
MSGRWQQALWITIALGAVLRVILSLATGGSEFDTESFRLAADQLQRAPLQFYAALGGDSVRWPYPPGFLPWVWTARELSEATGLSFHTLICLPAIAADAAIAWFVQDHLGRRGVRPSKRFVAVALISLGPPFVVASGYLPQIDSVAFLPAVVAVWLWDREATSSQRRALVAGLLIGIGCAIKTTPILMLLALLPSCRDRREGTTLVAAAVAVPALLLIPFVLSTPHETLNTFGYGGVPGAGGLSLVVQPEMAERWLTEFHDLNRLNLLLFENRSIWTLLTLGLIGAFLVRHRTPAIRAAILLMLVVYVTGTGFFFQYLVWGLPFMLMAGYFGKVALIELAVALPMLLFYFGPWESEAPPVIYAVIMISLWAAMIAATVRLGRRERAESRDAGRERPPLGEALVDRLKAVTTRVFGSASSAPATPSGAAGRGALIAIAIALVAFAFLPEALIARGASTGEVFTGADGPYAADQLQYLAWIHDASSNLLTDNDFSLDASSHVYLNPMIAISGLVDRATGALEASFLIWKPIALMLLFGAFALYVRRTVRGRGAQAAALVMALFFASPFGPFADWLGYSGVRPHQLLELSADTLTGSLLWGYFPAAIAVGLIPLFLLGLERAEDPDRRRPGWSRRRYLLLTSLAGLLASWIHPWHGQILLLIVIGLMLWKPPEIRQRDLATVGFAVLLPLLYYLFLSEHDAAWELTRVANEGLPLMGGVVAVGLAPLILPALLAAAKPAASLQDRALRLWPLAAIGLHFISPTFPAHAFQGVALPLAILAVQGWQLIELPRRRLTAGLAVVAVGVLTLPGAISVAQQLADVVDARVQPHLLTADEDAALDFLRESPAPGGVLSTSYLGAAVPPFAERAVWAGHPSWTPNCTARATRADRLFDGRLAPSAARRFVSQTGARFLLSDCKDRADLGPALGSLVSDNRRFGCATVYTLRPASAR